MKKHQINNYQKVTIVFLHRKQYQDTATGVLKF